MKKNRVSKSFVKKYKNVGTNRLIVNGYSQKFQDRRNRIIQFVEDATGKKNPLVDRFNEFNKEEE